MLLLNRQIRPWDTLVGTSNNKPTTTSSSDTVPFSEDNCCGHSCGWVGGEGWSRVCLLVGCLTSQQRDSVSQGRAGVRIQWADSVTGL